jgi:hypothetical protein
MLPHREDHIALGMGGIAVDVAQAVADRVRGPVQGAQVREQPVGELGRRAGEGLAAVVGGVWMVGAAEQLLVEPVRAAAIALDAVLDRGAVAQIADLTGKRVWIAVGPRTRLRLI